ncbi:hypothetical protein NDA14_002088 [Ustilago hordei]|nr:hypothetical protein NDA10_002341 [Ustilago hordei]KAJ1598503.1 hypothetical protein NDA14_002088 [Ustilago hordei]
MSSTSTPYKLCLVCFGESNQTAMQHIQRTRLGMLYDAASHISMSVCSAVCCLMVFVGVWTAVRLSPADEGGTGLQVLYTAFRPAQEIGSVQEDLR